MTQLSSDKAIILELMVHMFGKLHYLIISVNIYNRLIAQVTPLSYDVTPLSYDVTPLSYDVTPLSYDVTPLSYDVTPLSYDVTPLSYDVTPLSYDVTLFVTAAAIIIVRKLY